MIPALSLLVPSCRPYGLDALLASLDTHAVYPEAWEVVALVDDEDEYIEFHHNYTEIHFPPQRPVSVATLLHECYKLARGSWVMFGNDDVVCETQGWDAQLFDAIEQDGQDGMSLFWPDDRMFGRRLACFPIVSRRLLDLIAFFPQPYQRYKVDDTLFHAVPESRRHFLPQITFRHLNDHGEVGYPLGDGRVYPVEREAAFFDNAHWRLEASRRDEMRARVASALAREVSHG